MLNFFIERPIFASVCSFMILMSGLLTIPVLPIENYPDIAPPSVLVTAIYTGANATTVETTVTSLIEQQINGVEGMEDTIRKRVGKTAAIGFGAQESTDESELDNLMGQVNHDDLLQYGLIPEFVGRLPVVVALDHLTHDDLMRILVEPKNAVVKQYQKFFKLDEVELVFTPDALQAAANQAEKRKTGARGLRTTIEEVLLDVMYLIPSTPFICCSISDVTVVSTV